MSNLADGSGSGSCPECLGINTLILEGEPPREARWRCAFCNSVFTETDLTEIEKKNKLC